MKIRFTESRLVCQDGYQLDWCKEGQTYDLPHETAAYVLRQGWGVKVPEKTIVDYRMDVEKAQGLLQHAIGYEFGEAAIQRQKEEVFFARIAYEQAERAWA